MAEARPQSPGVMDLHTSAISAGENSTASTDTGSFDANLANVVVDLQCPATPQVHLKLPELASSSSDSEPDEPQPSTADDETTVAAEARRDASPPPNCAICLGRCKNKCYTDSCRHQFCFKCLCEWSKVKPECPLCKQTFKSIIHNVKANNQFEEYHVQPPTVQIPHNPYDRLEQLHYVTDVLNRRNDYEIWDRPSIHSIIRGGRTIWIAGSSSANASGASGSSSNNNSTATNNSSIGGNVQSQYMNNELLQMYRQEYPDAIASTGTLSQLWRRYVYNRQLYALPVCDITGRLRESSARFYRDNPAQIHRLMPWINRDIVCLLRNTQHNVTAVLENINQALTIMSIVSPAFRRRLQPFLGSRTSHFVHELNNFARSPYDMIGYDRAVQYSPQAGEEIVIEFSTSASSDEEFNGISGPVDEQGNLINRRNPIRDSVAAALSASAAAAAVAVTTFGPSTSTSSTRIGNNSGSIEYRAMSRGSNTSAAVATTTTSSSPSQPSPNNSLVNLLSFSISTTSEGAEAPGVSVAVNGETNGGAGGGRGAQSTAINLTTHNRSHEVIIDSDTDSENALVIDEHDADEILANVIAIHPTHSAPTVVDNIELTTGSSDECEFVLERKPPHLRTPEMVSLNSESDSDVVFVDESKTALGKSTFSSSGGEDEQEQPTTTANSKQKLTALVPKKTVMQSLAAPVKHEEELYNVGASTSTGLRSSGGRRGLSIYEAAAGKRNLRSHQQRRPYSKRYGSTIEASAGRRGKRGGVSDCSGGQPPAETPSYLSSDCSSSSMSHSSSDEEVYNASLKRMKLKRRITRKSKRTNEANSTATTTTTSGKKRNHCKDIDQTTMTKKRKVRSHHDNTDSDTCTSDDEYESLSLKELKGRLCEIGAEEHTYTNPRDDASEQAAPAEDSESAKATSTTNNTVHEQQNTSTGDDEEIVQYLTTMKAQNSNKPANILPTMSVKNEPHNAAADAAIAVAADDDDDGNEDGDDDDDNENEHSFVSTTETNKARSLSHNSACSPTSTLTSASSSDTSSSSSTSSAYTSSSSSSESAEDSDSNDDAGNKNKDEGKEHDTFNRLQQNTNIFDINSTFEQMLNAVSNADSNAPWPADGGGSSLNEAIDSSNELHHLTPQLEAAATLADFANTDTRLNFDLPIYSDEDSNTNDDNGNVEHDNNL